MPFTLFAAEHLYFLHDERGQLLEAEIIYMMPIEELAYHLTLSAGREGDISLVHDLSQSVIT